jgi:hypothetical protein
LLSIILNVKFTKSQAKILIASHYLKQVDRLESEMRKEQERNSSENGAAGGSSFSIRLASIKDNEEI